MEHVVDASVAAKWFLPEPHKDKAERLLREFLDQTVELIAPDLIVSEVGNTLWKRHVLIRDISAQQATDGFSYFLAIGIPLLQPSAKVAATALDIAIQERHRIYDTLYVALAAERGCDFITADEKLVNKLKGKFPFIRWLGDL